jgi:SAM-dependent methyltransferase
MSLPRLQTKFVERRRYRAEHVADILDLLRPQVRIALADCRMLDIGSGYGAICVPASRFVRSVVAVDNDPRLLETARSWAQREGRTNMTFRNVSVLDLASDSFDIVICSDVIEHVEDQEGVAAAIARSLAPGGVFYLTTNNRWWPMEGHFGLPFLSWLPRRLADRYVRFMGRGSRYDVHPLSLAQTTGLLSRNGLAWTLVPPLRPHTRLYRIGKRLVERDPSWWKVANAFQIVGRKRETAASL